MAGSKQFRVLIAIDDSSAAKAAIATVLKFPWPQATQIRGVVALQVGESPLQSKQLDDALEASLRGSADLARNALSARSGNAEVVGINKPPIEAILGEAKASRANIIALGWRGHGSFRRLLAGSVSRSVAARAESSVLVVRSAPQTVRRFVIGYDDSPNARRAVQLLCRLEPARGSRAVLVSVIELVAPTGIARLPSGVRTSLRSELAALHVKRYEQAQTKLKGAVEQLKRAGWTARSEVRQGSPLTGVLAATKEHQADILVLGARATSGLTRLLLGSVAQGALDHSRTPVLLVR